jgi:hypothetical protein
MTACRFAAAKLLMLPIALSAAFSACEKPTAKFQPGDRVRVKVTQIEGEVILRTRFFRNDLYHLKLPGKYYVFFPIREREERAAEDAKYGLTDYSKPWHSEGPFYESELELCQLNGLTSRR